MYRQVTNTHGIKALPRVLGRLRSGRCKVRYEYTQPKSIKTIANIIFTRRMDSSLKYGGAIPHAPPPRVVFKLFYQTTQFQRFDYIRILLFQIGFKGFIALEADVKTLLVGNFF